MKVVTNASPLIALASIGQLPLLADLFGLIHIPTGVHAEVFSKGRRRAGTPDPSVLLWLKQVRVRSKSEVVAFSRSHKLGRGETEAILLAERINADWLVIDERRARRIAIDRELKVIGTLGVLLLAKSQGLITEVGSLLDRLISAGFYVAEPTLKEVLRRADEAGG